MQDLEQQPGVPEAREDESQAIETQEAAAPKTIEDRIAQRVRADSREQGKLSTIDAIESLFTESDPDVDFGQMSQDERYADIQILVAPSGSMYLYSSEYLEPEEAAHKSALEEAQARIAEKVRQDSSQQVKLTSLAYLASLIPELEFEEGLLDSMTEDERYKDIQLLTASNGTVYLYSSQHMTKTYATLLARAEVNDPAATIAETVRDESRIYPRPTSTELFKESVFNIKAGEIMQHVERLLEREEYQDIKKIIASTGAVYLYSDRYMSEPQARRLVQWIEVDQHENP